MGFLGMVSFKGFRAARPGLVRASGLHSAALGLECICALYIGTTKQSLRKGSIPSCKPGQVINGLMDQLRGVVVKMRLHQLEPKKRIRGNCSTESLHRNHAQDFAPYAGTAERLSAQALCCAAAQGFRWHLRLYWAGHMRWMFGTMIREALRPRPNAPKVSSLESLNPQVEGQQDANVPAHPVSHIPEDLADMSVTYIHLLPKKKRSPLASAAEQLCMTCLVGTGG